MVGVVWVCGYAVVRLSCGVYSFAGSVAVTFFCELRIVNCGVNWGESGGRSLGIRRIFSLLSP